MSAPAPALSRMGRLKSSLLSSQTREEIIDGCSPVDGYCLDWPEEILVAFSNEGGDESVAVYDAADCEPLFELFDNETPGFYATRDLLRLLLAGAGTPPHSS